MRKQKVQQQQKEMGYGFRISGSSLRINLQASLMSFSNI